MTIEAQDKAVTVATVSVFERGLTALRMKVAKLNKRAKRFGMNELSLRVVSAEPKIRQVGKGRSVPDVWTTIEIDGCEPCINGYRLIAKVEFNGTIGNVVRICPGNDDDGSFSQYRAIGPVCEHCNSNRRRNDVFVIAGPDGHRKIVGRNCLADYIRSGDAAALAFWAECADCFAAAGGDGDADDSDWHEYTGGNGNPAMPLGVYLQVVALVKRKFGWLGRTAARASFDGIATADDAARFIYGRGAAHERWLRENDLCPDDDDADYADRAIEWCANLDEDRNEYTSIIARIAQAGCVDMRKLDGYAASILVAYDKDCEREIERKAFAAGAKDKVYYGSPKQREKGVRVKCVGLSSGEGQYGTWTLVRFEHYPNDTDRAVLVWFASGDVYNAWKLEAEYDVDFTCKGHDDHPKFGAQTKINRCKAVAGPFGGVEDADDDDRADGERLAGYDG